MNHNLKGNKMIEQLGRLQSVKLAQKEKILKPDVAAVAKAQVFTYNTGNSTIAANLPFPQKLAISKGFIKTTPVSLATMNPDSKSYENFKQELSKTIQQDFAKVLKTTPDQVDLSKIITGRWGVGEWPIFTEEFFQHAYWAQQVDLSDPEKAVEHFSAETIAQYKARFPENDRRIFAFVYGTLSRPDLLQNTRAQAEFVKYIVDADGNFGPVYIFPGETEIVDLLRDRPIDLIWPNAAHQNEILEALVAKCRDRSSISIGLYRRAAEQIADLSLTATGKFRQRFIAELEGYLAPKFSDKESEAWNTRFAIEHLSRLKTNDFVFTEALSRLLSSPHWTVAKSAAFEVGQLKDANDSITTKLLDEFQHANAFMFDNYVHEVFPHLIFNSPKQRQRLFDFFFKEHLEIFNDDSSVRYIITAAMGGATLNDPLLRERLILLAKNPPIKNDQSFTQGLNFAFGAAQIQPQKLEYQLELVEALLTNWSEEWPEVCARKSLNALYANDPTMLALIKQTESGAPEEHEKLIDELRRHF